QARKVLRRTRVWQMFWFVQTICRRDEGFFKLTAAVAIIN
uniref:Uncharacterized protein n=1 Tax=Aegilops tauschii subsp. strangulata TaxID=200361 RepID=A0A452ZBQ7_AEGTS